MTTTDDRMELAEILDEYTPHAIGVMNQVPPAERRMLAALLIEPDPVKMKDLAAAARMEPRAASVMIGRLLHRRGLCRKVERGWYTYADPWLAMWYRARNAPPGPLDAGEITAGIADIQRILADGPAMLRRIRSEAGTAVDDLQRRAETEGAAWK